MLCTELTRIDYAMNNTKNEKANGPYGAVLDMLKTGGEPCLNSLTVNSMISKLPGEWMLSLLVPIIKSKRDTLREINFLEHGFKFYEKVFNGLLCKSVDIHKMQYYIMPGKGTIDAVFLSNKTPEKFRTKNKKMFFVFFDLERAFEWVPSKVLFLLRVERVSQNTW